MKHIGKWFSDLRDPYRSICIIVFCMIFFVFWFFPAANITVIFIKIIGIILCLCLWFATLLAD